MSRFCLFIKIYFPIRVNVPRMILSNILTSKSVLCGTLLDKYDSTTVSVSATVFYLTVRLCYFQYWNHWNTAFAGGGVFHYDGEMGAGYTDGHFRTASDAFNGQSWLSFVPAMLHIVCKYGYAFVWNTWLPKIPLTDLKYLLIDLGNHHIDCYQERPLSLCTDRQGGSQSLMTEPCMQLSLLRVAISRIGINGNRS